MSEDWMLKTLANLGLKKVEAKVYVFLATNGPQEARGLCIALKLSKQKLCHSLKNLRDKSIVNASIERPTRFSAVDFERVLDLFLKSKIEQQLILHEIKEELRDGWKSAIK